MLIALARGGETPRQLEIERRARIFGVRQIRKEELSELDPVGILQVLRQLGLERL